MKQFGKIAAAALLALGAGTISASADACSGHSHDTGTAVGAVGGGLIGGLATHSVLGGLGGAVIGGVAAMRSPATRIATIMSAIACPMSTAMATATITTAKPPIGA